MAKRKKHVEIPLDRRIEKIINLIWQSEEPGMKVPAMAAKLGWSRATVRRTMEEAAQIGLVRKTGPHPQTSGVGRPYMRWELA